jgi:transposase
MGRAVGLGIIPISEGGRTQLCLISILPGLPLPGYLCGAALRQALSKEEYSQIQGAMWPFRKSPKDLDDKEQALLERLFDHSPKLKQAYTLREELTAIFERDYTKRGAKCAIRAWCKRVRNSGLDEFESFLGTVDTWLDLITNYFLEGWSSGFVEGFNNRVKVLKRRCYGIFDVETMFQRLSLDLDGYEKFGFT